MIRVVGENVDNNKYNEIQLKRIHLRKNNWERFQRGYTPTIICVGNKGDGTEFVYYIYCLRKPPPPPPHRILVAIVLVISHRIATWTIVYCFCCRALQSSSCPRQWMNESFLGGWRVDRDMDSNDGEMETANIRLKERVPGKFIGKQIERDPLNNSSPNEWLLSPSLHNYSSPTQIQSSSSSSSTPTNYTQQMAHSRWMG